MDLTTLDNIAAHIEQGEPLDPDALDDLLDCVRIWLYCDSADSSTANNPLCKRLKRKYWLQRRNQAILSLSDHIREIYPNLPTTQAAEILSDLTEPSTEPDNSSPELPDELFSDLNQLITEVRMCCISTGVPSVKTICGILKSDS